MIFRVWQAYLSDILDHSNKGMGFSMFGFQAALGRYVCAHARVCAARTLGDLLQVSGHNGGVCLALCLWVWAPFLSLVAHTRHWLCAKCLAVPPPPPKKNIHAEAAQGNPTLHALARGHLLLWNCGATW